LMFVGCAESPRGLDVVCICYICPGGGNLQ